MAERNKYTVGGISPDITELAILDRPDEQGASQSASAIKVDTLQRAQTHSIDEDFHAWLLDQASLLRNQQYQLLDWNNLAEELEAMAVAQKRELLERLATVYEHLLKLERQPDPRRERNRKITIAKTRTAIKSLLKFSPGLKGQLEELAAEAYADGRRHAGTDLGLSRRQWEKEFPHNSPWTVEEILDDDFFPSPAKS